MLIKPSLLIGFAWLVLSIVSALGATSSIEGIIKDAKGQPVKVLMYGSSRETVKRFSARLRRIQAVGMFQLVLQRALIASLCWLTARSRRSLRTRKRPQVEQRN
jgi:hypothetical protein